jgi:hypothetical protein
VRGNYETGNQAFSMHLRFWTIRLRNFIARRELVGVAVLVIIGIALIVLAPAKRSGELASAGGT